MIEALKQRAAEWLNKPKSTYSCQFAIELPTGKGTFHSGLITMDVEAENEQKAAELVANIVCQSIILKFNGINKK